VVVNETPKFQCLEPTEHSHTISVIGDDVAEVLIISFEMNGFVSFFQHSNHPKRNLIYMIGMS
jgi:hypothetical protein